MISTCRTVVLRGDVKRIPPNIFYAQVSIGISIGSMTVGFCSPSPCILTPATKIQFSDRFSLKTEDLETDVKVVARYGDAESVYVYPRGVWESVSRYIESFWERGYPREPALIMIGPPGTGKSTMLKLISDYLGVYKVYAEPETILSKWLGESEKKFFSIFVEAENNPPSVILFDEAEWAISKTYSSYRSAEQVSLNIKNILKRKIDEYGKRRQPILAVFASNITEEDIDDAMIRSGRAYRPIVVPLPSWRAVRTVIEEYFPQVRDQAERLATIFINAGLSMADVFRVMDDYVSRGILDIKQVRSRGYSRMIASQRIQSDEEVRAFLSALSERLDLKNIVGYKKLRIAVRGSFPVLAPIISVAIVTETKRPAIILSDARFIDEALDTTRSIEGVLIIDVDNLPQDAVMVASSQPIPIIAIGSDMDKVRNYKEITVPLDLRPELRMAPVKILLDTMGIERTPEELARIRNNVIRPLSSADYRRFLESLALTGSLQLSL